MQRVFELLDDISWQNKALGIIVHCPEEYFARRLCLPVLHWGPPYCAITRYITSH